MTSSRFRRALFTAVLTVSVSVGVQAQAPPGLEAQHQRLLPLFELAGVVFTDADETRGLLVVGVLNRGLEASVRARLLALGVPSGSVEVVETEAIVRVATLRDKVRPLVGGLQIRFSQYLCSLGFNAVRAGIEGFVTASHCSDTQGGVDGTQYYQPLNQVADEFIGTEVADPPFFRNREGCPRGRKCRYSDANFSDRDDAATATLGGIAKTTGANNGSLEIAGEFAISAEGAASVGDIANKVGRTTGWTQGTVTRTCVNTGVSGTNIVLFCQGFVESVESGVQIVDSGDSGSPVFRIEPGSNTVTLLGNLWGGSSSGDLFVYSPVANIEQELGALTTIDEPTAPAAPTNLTATSGDSQVGLSWTGSSGATSYNVSSRESGASYSTLVTGLSTTSYTDATVTNGITYDYIVTAVNAVGPSAPSNEASATPTASVGVTVTADPQIVVNQNDSPVEFTITGTGFADEASVAFENGSGPAPRVTSVIWKSATALSVTIEIRSGGPPRDRVWDGRVTNPDGSTGVGQALLRITGF